MANYVPVEHVLLLVNLSIQLCHLPHSVLNVGGWGRQITVRVEHVLLLMNLPIQFCVLSHSVLNIGGG